MATPDPASPSSEPPAPALSHLSPQGGITGSLELAPGLKPIADYELVQFLGCGGFGEVWKAKGPGGYHVALKLFRLGDRSATVELHALEVVKEVRHPHLLSVFGAWQNEGLLVVAMELADGTLHDRLKEALDRGLPGIPPEDLIRFLRGAAEGIDYLNEQGIQHRDIKPQNLLLVGGGVKVGDFGLAKLLEKNVASASANMTPSFAAPEFLDGRVSRWSDQYSLAVTYCELRTGRRPFEGNLTQILTGHMIGVPDLAMLPEAERSAVARALAKQPDQRWPTCAAFAEGLAIVATGQPPPLKPAPVGDTLTCPECGKKLRAPATVAGKKVRCPVCKAPLMLPSDGAGDVERTRALARKLPVVVPPLISDEPPPQPARGADLPWVLPGSGSKTEALGGPRWRHRPLLAVAALAAILSVVFLVLLCGIMSAWISSERAMLSSRSSTVLAQETRAKAPEEAAKKPSKDKNRLPPDNGKPKDKEGPALDQRLNPAPEINNSIGMKLVMIPAGEFTMGSNDQDAYGDERPPHKVTITKAFYLGQQKVTVGQFKDFVADDNDFKTDAEKENDNLTWNNPNFHQTNDHPVVYVSWNDAQAYCKWLSRKEGKTYRLPYESEWEYACRAGSKTRFHFGDDHGRLGEYAWYTANSGNKTHPVGQKKPNAWKLFDMHGNVWEWCEDGKRTYRDRAETDPQGPMDDGSGRIHRGGGWGSDPRGCRSAYRNGRAPGARHHFLGFRLLLVP